MHNPAALAWQVNGKQLDVIKEADSPTFYHPIPQVAHKRVFKKWPKDFKSFSHELGPRGGRTHDVQRPHSDNDLEVRMYQPVIKPSFLNNFRIARHFLRVVFY